ncbi:MAG: hypothetical protein ABIS45_13640 [Burkholderiales bacterium]
MEKLAVVSPAGLAAVKSTGIAPRLADLNGKTVAEVWNGVFKGDLTFPVVRRLLKAKFPDIRIIPYTEFYHLPGSDVPAQQREVAREIVTAAMAKGVDAVISGNGA